MRLSSVAIGLGLSLAAAPPAASDAHFLVYKPTTARSEPRALAKATAQLTPLDLRVIHQVLPGWIEVDEGFIQVRSRDELDQNMLGLPPDDEFSAIVRVRRMRESPWPLSVRLDIARGRVRVGMTPAQVRAARNGDAPDTVVSKEVAAGEVEVWSYGLTIITFAGGAVTEIVQPKSTARAGAAERIVAEPTAEDVAEALRLRTARIEAPERERRRVAEEKLRIADEMSAKASAAIPILLNEEAALTERTDAARRLANALNTGALPESDLIAAVRAMVTASHSPGLEATAKGYLRVVVGAAQVDGIREACRASEPDSPCGDLILAARR